MQEQEQAHLINYIKDIVDSCDPAVILIPKLEKGETPIGLVRNTYENIWK